MLAPTARSQGSWTERYQRALDEDTFVEFVAELRAEAASGPRSPEFAQVYADATSMWIGFLRPEEGDRPALDERRELARAAAAAIGVEPRLRVENEYAKALTDRGEFATARTVLERGLDEYPGAKFTAAETYCLLAALRVAEGAWPEALDELARALDQVAARLREEERDPAFEPWRDFHSLLRVRLLGQFSKTWLALGMPALAERSIAQQEDALASLSEDGGLRPFGEFAAGLDRGEFHATVMDPEAALATYESLEPIVGQLGPEHAAELELHAAMAVLNVRRMKSTPGTAELDRLSRALDSDRLTKAQRARGLELLASCAIRAGQYEKAAAWIESCSSQGAFAAGERRDLGSALVPAMRTELVIARGAPRADLETAAAELATAFEQVLGGWDREPLRTGGRGVLYTGATKGVLSACLRARLALDAGAAGEEAALRVLLRAQSRGTLVRSLGIGEVSLDEVRAEALGERTGALVWLPSADRTHLFSVDRTSVRHYELPGESVLYKLVRRAREEIALRAPDEGSPEFEERLESLRSVLDALGIALLPAEARDRLSGWDTVLVAGLEMISDAPLELISFGASDLGRERAVARVPSLPAAVALARRARSQPEHAGRIALIAAPRPGRQTLERFPEARAPLAIGREVRAALRRRFELVEREAEAATLAALRAPEVASASVLIFVLHGAYDAKRPSNVGLLLSDEPDGSPGFLSAEVVERLERVPPVVMLLGCRASGAGDQVGDDTGSHLAAAFLRRGANSVFVARGEVASDVMLGLAGEISSAFANDGVTPAESLRRARVALGARTGALFPTLHGQVTCDGVGFLRPAIDLPTRADQTTTGAPSEGAPGFRAWIAAASFAALVVAWTSVSRRRRRHHS